MPTPPHRHLLYQRAVQCVQAEVDFVDATFRALRGRPPRRMREDFCGTAATCAEWVRRGPRREALGVDLDGETLDWGRAHNLGRLTPARARRVELRRRDVRAPGPGADRMDAILAMNFSYWVFKTRSALRGYFRSVRRSLGREGVFFMDIYGGWESMKPQRERRPIGGGGRRGRGFIYWWEQESFDPITHRLVCHISFSLPGRWRIRRAFTYDWRLWTIPEVREVLAEAGFSRSSVYWEGDDGKGGGNGEFTLAQTAEADPCVLAYIVAER
ncbi:MAG: methyltransferase domain-containing protein [Phycisphaerae bacterium]|nr:methyltransferase domain-containing protein [Phycisphaerae bacterium]